MSCKYNVELLDKMFWVGFGWFFFFFFLSFKNTRGSTLCVHCGKPEGN